MQRHSGGRSLHSSPEGLSHRHRCWSYSSVSGNAAPCPQPFDGDRGTCLCVCDVCGRYIQCMCEGVCGVCVCWGGGGQQHDLLIPIGTDACVLIVEGAVDVRAIVEGAVPPLDGSPPPLVHEVPVEAGEGAMLVALVLEECLTLLHTKFLQVPCG